MRICSRCLLAMVYLHLAEAMKSGALASTVVQDVTKREAAKLVAEGLLLTLNSLPVTVRASMLPLLVGPGSHETVVSFLHSVIPLLLLTDQGSQWTSIKYPFSPFPKPFAVMVLFEDANESRQRNLRALLSCMLNNLRSTPLWSADAWVLVALADATQASSVQRALARAEALRAFAVTLQFSTPSRNNASTTPTVVGLALQPARRPPRVPPATPLPARLPRALDISSLSVVFAVFTQSVTKEQQCLGDQFPWKYSSMDRIVHEIKEKLGFKALCWSENTRLTGYRMRNGTYTGLVRKVVSGTADILAFNSPGSTDWEIDLDQFYPYELTHQCFYVRKAVIIPFVNSLLSSFSKNAALGLLVSLIATCFTLILAGENIQNATFRTVGTFMTGEFRTRGKRVILGLSIMTSLFSIIMLNALQSRATSYLSVPLREPEINTLRDLNERISLIYGSPSLLQYFPPDESSLIASISQKFIPTDSISDWYEVCSRAVKQGDVSLILGDDVAPYIIWNRKFSLDGYLLMRKVKECLVTASPIVFLAKKHSPYMSIINDILQQLVQTGVNIYLSKISKESMHIFDLVPFIKGPMRMRPYSLKLTHIPEAFYLLCIGLSLSIFAFIVENITMQIHVNVVRKKQRMLMKGNKCMRRKHRRLYTPYKKFKRPPYWILD